MRSTPSLAATLFDSFFLSVFHLQFYLYSSDHPYPLAALTAVFSAES